MTPRELKAIKILWDNGKATVREIHADMSSEQPQAYTSILSLMQTMEKKGLVGHEQIGKTYHYYAKAPRSTTLGKMVRGMVDSVFDGALSEYVARALQSKKVSLEELDEIESLIKQAKRDVKESRSKGDKR